MMSFFLYCIISNICYNNIYHDLEFALTKKVLPRPGFSQIANFSQYIQDDDDDEEVKFDICNTD